MSDRPTKGRRFDFSEMDSDAREKLKQIEDRVAQAAERNEEEELGKLGLQMRDLFREQAAKQRRKYPDEPPNDAARYSLIRGLMFDPEGYDAGKKLTRLLDFRSEQISLWDPADTCYIHLISKVDDAVKDEEVWRTFASCLQIASSILSSFDSFDDKDFEYQWIYQFDPSQGSDQQK